MATQSYRERIKAARAGPRQAPSREGRMASPDHANARNIRATPASSALVVQCKFVWWEPEVASDLFTPKDATLKGWHPWERGGILGSPARLWPAETDRHRLADGGLTLGPKE